MPWKGRYKAEPNAKPIGGQQLSCIRARFRTCKNRANPDMTCYVCERRFRRDSIINYTRYVASALALSHRIQDLLSGQSDGILPTRCATNSGCGRFRNSACAKKISSSMHVRSKNSKIPKFQYAKVNLFLRLVALRFLHFSARWSLRVGWRGW